MQRRYLAERMENTQNSAVRELLKYSRKPGMISLAGGIPAADLFDMDGLREALDAEMCSAGRDTFQYGLSEGDPDLRQQVSLLLKKRGIHADSNNILITSGSQQALDIVARVLIQPSDVVLVERAAYLAALQVFALAEATLLPVMDDVNDPGLENVKAALSQQKAKLIYVVPNFSNPTGRTLSTDTRRRLVTLAREYGAVIIEDDPYGEIRFDGTPRPSLYEISQGIPGAEKLVIYVSSFSKILAPGLRTGWMVIPDDFYEYFAIAKQAVDLHTGTLSQRIIARYISSRKLDIHLPILQESYRHRRDALCNSLRKHLGNHIRFNVPEGGMFLWAEFPEGVDASEVLRHAIDQGVVFVPGVNFFAGSPKKNTLRLSYSTITTAEAEESARRLTEALRLTSLREETNIRQ